MVEGGPRRRGEVLESEERKDVLGIENAERRVLLEFNKDLNKGFFGEKKESKAGGFRRGKRRNDGN